MPRYSLMLRVAAMMTLAVSLSVVIVGMAVYMRQAAEAGGHWRMPFPDQLAALVEVVESSPPEQLPRLQRALNSSGLSFRIEPGPPAREQATGLPVLAAITQSYVEALKGRKLTIDLITPSLMRSWLGWIGSSATVDPMLIRIGLHDDRVLHVEVHPPLLGDLAMQRITIAVVLLTVLVGLTSLLGLWRQIGPLDRLALAVERLGTDDDDGSPLKPGGAAEVRLLITAFNRMRERIRDLLVARGRMLAAISHDLGTYLTRLRLRIEAIPDPQQRAAAERDIEDMQRLLCDTMAVSRLEAAVDVQEHVELGTLITRELAAYRESGAAVSLRSSQPMLVQGDAVALRRVLGNLIGNALRYAGAAELELRRNGSAAELLVDDRGPGIPEDELSAVLEPFYRRDPARNLDDGGSGLGLAIVADIVRRHAGELKLEERPGGGLRVRIRLPLVTAHQLFS